MSNPQHKPYSITVFIVEMSQRRQRFDTPEVALAWCRKHRAGLVYSPAENVASN